MLPDGMALRALHVLLAGAAALWAVDATAQAGDVARTSGQAAAAIVEPAQIQALSDLRFGTIVRPPADGTVTVTPNGNVTSTIDLSRFPGNRGPASFRVKGDPRRFFVTYLPAVIEITNGSARMSVDRFRANTSLGFARFDAAGNFILNIGGRLAVSRTQPVGKYSGTFELTVLYL